MKQILKVFFLTVLLSAFSCGNNDDGDQDLQDWIAANEQAFNALKTNPAYRELKSPGNEGSIYYKVLTEGAGTEPIYYTDTVVVYYKGWLTADYPALGFSTGAVFDQRLFDDGTPATFSVMGLVSGWKTALQNMKKGDKWEIWMPYQLGYGSSAQYDSNGVLNIPGYSTLAFEIEVVDVL